MEKETVHRFASISNLGTHVFMDKMEDMIQIYNHTEQICFDDFNLFMPKGAIFCWISGIVIFEAQGALCNLLPSYAAIKYGCWDYIMGYQVMGAIFEINAGIGVMMNGFFKSGFMMRPHFP